MVFNQEDNLQVVSQPGVEKQLYTALYVGFEVRVATLLTDLWLPLSTFCPFLGAPNMVIIDRLIAQMVAAILYSSVAQAIHSHIIQKYCTIPHLSITLPNLNIAILSSYY